MAGDADACESFWNDYLEGLPPDHPHRGVSPDSFGFGDSAELADDLAELVLRGKKRATASLPIEFSSLGEELPRVGDMSIILRGDLTPVAIIERTEVTAVPFESVGEAFAATEGEGDGSLGYWRAAHRDYFAAVCARFDGTFDPRTRVLCQTFRVVWPKLTAD